MKVNTVRVRFDRPGVKAIGAYRPGTEYDVTPAEGERLVKHKGFHYVGEAVAAPDESTTEER